MSTRLPSAPAEFNRLAPTDRIDEELVLGAFPLAEAGSLAAMEVPSIDRLLRGVELMTRPLTGELLNDSAALRQINRELSEWLGGWFRYDLTPFLQVHRDLVSTAEKQQWGPPAMLIHWDHLPMPPYTMALRHGDWRVQAVGAAGVFHCVSFGQPLTAEKAVGPGGHPRRQPLGPARDLLAPMIPLLFAEDRLVDRSQEHAVNVFDTYLEGDRLVVRAGVRRRLDGGREEDFGGTPYHYAIRICIDLRH